jgi:hypothetical protein
MIDTTKILALLMSLLLVGLALPACDGEADDDDDSGTGDDDDVADDDDATADDDDATAGDDDDATAKDATISGVIVREFSTCPPSGDGIGTLCVSLQGSCDDFGTEVASFELADADMSWPTNEIAYELTELADGVWQLYSWLDEDGAGCDGGADTGDFIVLGLCLEVEVAGQADVTDFDVTFNTKL